MTLFILRITTPFVYVGTNRTVQVVLTKHRLVVLIVVIQIHPNKANYHSGHPPLYLCLRRRLYGTHTNENSLTHTQTPRTRTLQKYIRAIKCVQLL